jgi:putative heme iron utilization protein
LTETGDAAELLAAEPEILAHMNGDHADALRLYATKLLGAPDGEWRCVG